MKFWQQPAQPLPVQLRPFGGETVISYTHRLSAANELPRPTTLLRALGEPTRPLLSAMITDSDISLNEHSLRRLEAFTGIPAQQLRKALPSLNRTTTRALPTDIPATKPYRCRSLRTPCDHCAARLPGRPTIAVHPLLFPRICTRHSRWVDTSNDQPRQVDLINTPEILTAHRRFARLRSATKNNEWLGEQLHHATWIARRWATGNNHATRRLRERWTARDTVLRPQGGSPHPTPLLVFPEAIAIAEIISDLPWRRHVAMVNDWDLATFYRRVAHRLEQPRTFAGMVGYTSTDPLRGWVGLHRHAHAQVRTDFWHQHRHGLHLTSPFPEIRHFK